MLLCRIALGQHIDLQKLCSGKCDLLPAQSYLVRGSGNFVGIHALEQFAVKFNRTFNKADLLILRVAHHAEYFIAGRAHHVQIGIRSKHIKRKSVLNRLQCISP